MGRLQLLWDSCWFAFDDYGCVVDLDMLYEMRLVRVYIRVDRIVGSRVLTIVLLELYW